MAGREPRGRRKWLYWAATASGKPGFPGADIAPAHACNHGIPAQRSGAPGFATIIGLRRNRRSPIHLPAGAVICIMRFFVKEPVAVRRGAVCIGAGRDFGHSMEANVLVRQTSRGRFGILRRQSPADRLRLDSAPRIPPRRSPCALLPPYLSSTSNENTPHCSRPQVSSSVSRTPHARASKSCTRRR